MNASVSSKRGFARLKWLKLRERNGALDCRVHARAAAWMVGADRWSEAHWADIEEQDAGKSKAYGVKTRPPLNPPVPQSGVAQVRGFELHEVFRMPARAPESPTAEATDGPASNAIRTSAEDHRLRRQITAAP